MTRGQCSSLGFHCKRLALSTLCRFRRRTDNVLPGYHRHSASYCSIIFLKIRRFSGSKPMPRNRVQHQKGLSDDAFEQRYPDEEACRKAWFAWRWPEGFKCPRCAETKYSEIRHRQLLQCRRCRYQTSLIAGTILQGTKLS